MGDKQEGKCIERLEVVVGMWKIESDKGDIEELRVGPFHGANTTLQRRNKSIYTPTPPHGGTGGDNKKMIKK